MATGDMCPLIPLQELIDLKMLQCKRVVNGECGCGPRIVRVPSHAQAVLTSPLPGCQCPLVLLTWLCHFVDPILS